MTKEEINILFEHVKQKEYLEILEYINDYALKTKIMSYENIEEGFEEEKERIGRNIYSQIPKQFLDYFCDKAIEAKAPSYLIGIEEDYKKMELIEKSENEYIMAEIAKTLEDDYEKIQVIRILFVESFKEEIANTIKDDDYKKEVIELLEYEEGKLEIAKNINSDAIKLELLSMFEDDYEKSELAKTMKSDFSKIEAIDTLKQERYIVKVAVTIESDDSKIQMLDLLESSIFKEELVKNIDSDSKKLELLSLFDERRQLEIIKTIKEDDYKIKALDMFKNKSQQIKIISMIKEQNRRFEELIRIGYKKHEVKVIKDLIDSTQEPFVMEKYLYEESVCEKIGLPEEMSFGVELEAEGELAKFLIDTQMMYGWLGKEEASIPEGVEIVSPILRDREDDLQELEIICNAMQEAGLGTTEECGGHIHIGARYLDSEPQALQNLVTIWNECEELFYKMGNEKGVVPRGSIIKWATTSHSVLEEMYPNGEVKIKNEDDFKEVCSKMEEKQQKYRGMNTDNYGKHGKDTIEFRIPNGTLNINTIKDNIRLFGSIFQVAKQMAIEPEYKKEEFEKIKDRGLTEAEKVEALLDLLFVDEKIKSIYRERWDFVKDEEVFNTLTQGENPTFKRGDYRIAGKDNFGKVAREQDSIEEMQASMKEISQAIEQKSLSSAVQSKD